MLKSKNTFCATLMVDGKAHSIRMTIESAKGAANLPPTFTLGHYAVQEIDPKVSWSAQATIDFDGDPPECVLNLIGFPQEKNSLGDWVKSQPTTDPDQELVDRAATWLDGVTMKGPK